MDTHYIWDDSTNPDDQIMEVGEYKGTRMGLNVYPQESGGYDVAIYVFDTDLHDWMAVGDADEVHNFSTRAEACEYGMQALLKEI